MRHPLLSVASIAALSLTLSACGAGGDSREALSVCTDVPYPPFEFQDASAALGYSGFDMELIVAIADHLDYQVAIVETGFDEITSGTAMESGACDLAISAISISASSEEVIDFSEPYYEAQQSLLVPQGSSITSLADLGEGVTVGVQTGTAGEFYARENVRGAEIFDSSDDLVALLNTGQVDAVIQDLAVNAEEAVKGEATIVETYATGEYFGIAFAKGSPLVGPVNEALDALRSDGTYDAVYETYFPISGE